MVIPNSFTGSTLRVRATATALLRANVARLAGGRTQRSLADAIGVKDATMSAFLNGHHGLGLDKLDPLAKELGVSVSALFDVPESTAVTSSGRAGTAKSSSQLPPSQGDGTDVEVGLLRARRDALEAENAALRAILDAIKRELTTYDSLAHAVGTTPARTTPRRGRRRPHDR